MSDPEHTCNPTLCPADTEQMSFAGCPGSSQTPPPPTPTSTPANEQKRVVCTRSTKQCILCVGFCALDMIHLCDVWPQEDIKKSSHKGYWQRGGNCSNMCTVLRQLNCKCEYLGNLSSNPGYAVLIQDFIKRGIEIKNCCSVPNEAPFCSIIISNNGTRTILVSVNNFPHYSFENFSRIDLKAYSWIHFEARNYDQMSKMIQAVCTFNNNKCKNVNCEHRIKLSLELEMVNEEFIPMAEYVDIVFVGKELANHMGWKTPYAAVHGIRSKLQPQKLASCRKPIIIAPWGSGGAALLTSEDEYELIPAAPAGKIVDTVGAGDTFCAGTIFAIDVMGKSIREAIEFGNHVAAFKIGYLGYDEIYRFRMPQKTICCCPQNT